MHELERRRAAIEASIARFDGKPHAYGTVDCAKVGAAHIRHMGHHRGLGLSKAGTYRSAVGASRALHRAGFASVGEAIERAGFEPIPAARLLPGDIVIRAGTDGLESLGIWGGNMTVWGFLEDDMERGLIAIRLFTLDDLKAFRL